MTRLIAFFLLAVSNLFLGAASAQSFNFEIYTPASNDIIGNSLHIEVLFYSSTYELASITAETDGRSTTLQGEFTGSYYYFNGYLNLSGLTQGISHKLKITCEDVLGNKKSDSVNYFYVNPPTAVIISPVAGDNAWPSLHIKTSHSGVDTCTSIVKVTYGIQTIFADTSVYNDIDTIVSFNSNLNGSGTVSLSVTDQWGQSGSVSVNIVFDSYLNYPYLTPLYTGTGNILSYKNNRILEARSNALYIVDSGFQSASAIPGNYTIPSSGSITDYGAVWGNYEWTNGTLYNLNSIKYSSVAGKYGVYKTYWQGPSEYGYDFYRRDLENRNLVQMAHTSGGLGTALIVDTNGSAVWNGTDNTTLVKYKNGNITSIGVDSGSLCQFNGPVIQGDTIIYSRYCYNFNSTQICMHDGISQTTLSDLGNNSIEGYMIAGKYIAYTRPSITGQSQIWLRDTTGNSSKKTFFGTGSYIAGLNPAGDLIYSNGSTLYYLRKDSTNAKALGIFVGSPFYIDSIWYVIKGKTLYRFNVNAYRTAAPGTWSNPASWQYNTVPLPAADVIVDTNIIVDINVVCNSLRIIPPGSITVSPGVNLTVLH